MIIDTLTKFNMRRKLAMTPEHPLCTKPKDFKIMYGASLILQAQVDQDVSPLNNFELERLLKSGFKLDSADIAWAIRTARNSGTVIDYLLDSFNSDVEKFFLMMDLINISISDGNISDKSKESIEYFAKTFSVQKQKLNVLWRFVEYAYDENIEECQNFAGIIKEMAPSLEISDLKYYIMQLNEDVEFTQKTLDEKKNFRLIDRCNIYDDIVLSKGMSLVIDHAIVRIYGNISLQGGELVIRNSKIVRKSDSHRACINLHTFDSKATVEAVEADCRSMGMFIRAEEGVVAVRDCTICNTTRGAAIRFWGRELNVANSKFSNCYSPEDGGAIMMRGGKADIRGCSFDDCEAKRGGAIYAIEGTNISECMFRRCNVAEYGAVLFYSGVVNRNVRQLKYSDCHPTGAEIVQHIAPGREIVIDREYKIVASTILDCPITISSKGKITAENANIYLNYPIRCMGSLTMKNVRVACSYLDSGDMIYLENAKECTISHCEFDGMLKTGGLNVLGSRINVTKSLFRNMSGGRAVYNAFHPEISDCIFNFCQDGAIRSQGGNIERCIFVNCRAKSGAGIQMYGSRGNIDMCIFRRCVTERGGGAIDRIVGTKINKCVFEGCRPTDVS